MGTAEKVAMGFVGIGLVTTLILPDRQTARVIDAFRKLFEGSFRASMGR